MINILWKTAEKQNLIHPFQTQEKWKLCFVEDKNREDGSGSEDLTKVSTSKLDSNDVVSDEGGTERTEELTEDQQQSKSTASKTQVENVQNNFNSGRYCCNLFWMPINLSFVNMRQLQEITSYVTRITFTANCLNDCVVDSKKITSLSRNLFSYLLISPPVSWQRWRELHCCYKLLHKSRIDKYIC